MSRDEIARRLDRYHLCANACAPGISRLVYMLGMMVCVAATLGRIVPMPAEWRWPAAAPLAGWDDG